MKRGDLNYNFKVNKTNRKKATHERDTTRSKNAQGLEELLTSCFDLLEAFKKGVVNCMLLADGHNTGFYKRKMAEMDSKALLGSGIRCKD